MRHGVRGRARFRVRVGKALPQDREEGPKAGHEAGREAERVKSRAGGTRMETDVAPTDGAPGVRERSEEVLRAQERSDEAPRARCVDRGDKAERSRGRRGRVDGNNPDRGRLLREK